MSTQAQNLPDAAAWKDRYLRTRQEFENREKHWAETEGGLYKSILRLIFGYTGQDAGLDRELAAIRDQLRHESSNSARRKIISPAIDKVVEFARQRDRTQHDPTAHLLYFLKILKLPQKNRQQFEKLAGVLANEFDQDRIRSGIDRLAKLIEEALRDRDADRERVQLRSDDPLTELLANLSLPGELGVEVMAMRKRANEIVEEQERLQLVQELVQLLTRLAREEGKGSLDTGKFPHLKETLLELFEWLSIPEQYSARVEGVKSRISSLQAEAELSAVLRETAIVINDLLAALQMELGDMRSFLGNVTSRLEEVENCFRDLQGTETKSVAQHRQLNHEIEDNVRTIREGIANTDDIREIKHTIESRLLFIEQSVGRFLAADQERQQFWKERIETLKSRIQKMKAETGKLQKRIQQEYQRAKTDTLTGIANRLSYNEKVTQEYARWQRSGQAFSICVIDVDSFKGVNDTYGHKAGDKVLKKIAGTCATNIREMDFIARYGGEEFVLLLPETSLEEALVVAENLRRQIENCKFHYAKKPVPITISCGVAEFAAGDEPEGVFKRADKALYKAKEQGRNRVVDERHIT